MDAVIRGTMEGVQLMLAVIGIIIVVFALVNLADQALALLPLVGGEALTLGRMFGWLFAPLMWAPGVTWEQEGAAGSMRRPAERGVGTEGVRTGRSRWSPE